MASSLRALPWLVLAGLLAPAAPGSAEPPAPAVEPGSFQVIVLRGAGVARVSGDGSGAIREEILREDRRPARREPAARPAPSDPAPEIVIVVNEAAYEPPVHPFRLGHRFFHPHFRRPHDARRGVAPDGRPRVAHPGGRRAGARGSR